MYRSAQGCLLPWYCLPTVDSTPCCRTRLTQKFNIQALSQSNTQDVSFLREYITSKPFGESRALHQHLPILTAINDMEGQLVSLSDEALCQQIATLRDQASNGVPLENLLVRTFAIVREAARRVVGMRHFDVQIVGGIVLHQGRIAEMATGEGKTLTATLPAVLNALNGRGVHVVTVNDYLAKRDAEWIGKIYSFLGLTVGVVTSDTPPRQRLEAFNADITYVTAYTMAYTYLNDNLIHSADEILLQRPLQYAIIDEVDSILIDEARNPFILSEASRDNKKSMWNVALQVARYLKPVDAMVGYMTGSEKMEITVDADCVVDRKAKSARLLEQGMVKSVQVLAQLGRVQFARDGDGVLHVILLRNLDLTETSLNKDGFLKIQVDIRPCSGLEGITDAAILENTGMVAGKLSELGLVEIPVAAVEEDAVRGAVPLVLWEGDDLAWGQYIVTAIKGLHLYVKGIDYIVKGDQVVVVDPSTGRPKYKSRWQLGIHQAVEAKEGVPVKSDDFEAASITYQVLFKFYEKLAGMSGTATVEAPEFHEAYNLTTVKIPPHKPSARRDHPPQFYTVKRAWELQLLSTVADSQRHKRPVLIGTNSVEQSEEIAHILRQHFGRRLNFNVLNALPENVKKEAQTIAQAGLPGTVTLATNMAGRGTDILLGGNAKGLTQMALELYFLPKLMASAGNGTNRPVPLLGLQGTFANEECMMQALPKPIVEAYVAAVASVSSSSSSSSSFLLGEMESEDDAAEWLSEELEHIEVLRSHFLLAHKLTILEDQILDQCVSWAKSSAATSSMTALQMFALVLWLWFDGECAQYGQEVRDSGGLMVVIASLQPSRRTELQLRGRAGRQGDPGETILLTSVADPMLRAFSDAAASFTSSAFDEFINEEQELLDLIRYADNEEDIAKIDYALHRVRQDLLNLPGVKMPPALAGLGKIVRSAENFYASGRESTRQFDEIINSFRMHVYDLRRDILTGGEDTRTSMMLHHISDIAVQGTLRYCSAAASPSKWQIQELLQCVHLLINNNRIAMDSESRYESKIIGDTFYVNLNGMPEGGVLSVVEGLLKHCELPPPKFIAEAHPKPSLWWRYELAKLQDNIAMHDGLNKPMVYAPYRGQMIRFCQWLAELLAISFWTVKDTLAYEWQLENPNKSLFDAQAQVRRWEQDVFLVTLDSLWADFLADVATLRNACSIKVLSQFDPLVEFKRDSSELFVTMLQSHSEAVIARSFDGARLRVGGRDAGRLLQEDDWLRSRMPVQEAKSYEEGVTMGPISY